MKQTIIVSMAIAVFFTTACNPSPIPPIISAMAPSSTAITVDNTATLVQLAEFSQGAKGPVAALAFTPNRTELRVVHARTPLLRHWSVLDHKMLAEYELESVGLGAAAFDETASLIVLAGFANDQIFGDDYMRGISAEQLFGPNDGIYFIDAESGQLLNRLRRPGNKEDFYGVALSRDGRIVATRRTEDLEQTIILDQKPELLVFGVSDRSAPASLLFSTAHSQGDFALDVEGRFLAIHVDHNGVVQLWDLESQAEWGDLKLSTNRSGTETSYFATKMAIAPTRQWLAVFSIVDSGDYPDLRQVTLWRLDERQVQWQTEIDARYVNAFAFNPFGTLLAAGASDGAHIWNVETGEEVKFFPGESAFAVAFSQDGSQVAWGDRAGVVHLAGLPVK